MSEVSIDSLGRLPTTGALAMAGSTGWGDRANLCFRMWGRFKHLYVPEDQIEGMIYGSDFYVIGFDEAGHFYTDQWDLSDEFLRLKSLSDPTSATVARVRRPREYPAGHTIYKFGGGYVHPPVWRRALTELETNMF